MESRRVFLSSAIEFFLGDGVSSLIQHVEQMIEFDDQLISWKVHETTAVGKERFMGLLRRIHAAMTSHEETISLWKGFMIYILFDPITISTGSLTRFTCRNQKRLSSSRAPE